MMSSMHISRSNVLSEARTCVSSVVVLRTSIGSRLVGFGVWNVPASVVAHAHEMDDSAVDRPPRLSIPMHANTPYFVSVKHEE
jgi:hypothetical protein